MKSFGLGLVLLLAALAPVGAQVTIEVKLDQDQFLPGEALPAAVRITNRSGQTLHLGAEEDWLTFSVESRDGFVVAKLGEVPVSGEFTLESSKTAIKRVDLAPYFALGQQGRYFIVASVKIKEWEHQIGSSPKGFNVIEGAKLWEQEFGIPKATGSTNETPEVRRYVLQQANYLTGQLRLYLRLSDASGAKTFRVFPVGPLVSFSRPEPQLDRFSNLHVIYANGAHTYSYIVFNPDGDVLARRTYEYVDTRPRLQPSDDGRVSVVGGVRRITANDVPAPTADASPNAVRPTNNP